MVWNSDDFVREAILKPGDDKRADMLYNNTIICRRGIPCSACSRKNNFLVYVSIKARL